MGSSSYAAPGRGPAHRHSPLRAFALLLLACCGGAQALPGWQFVAGFDGPVHALIEFDPGDGGVLVVAGEFTTAGGVAANRVAQWDGRSWSALGAGVSGPVYALAVHDPGDGARLVAGGFFGTPGNGVATWDGEAWSALGTGTSMSVLALASFGGQLVAGGNFTSIGAVPAGYTAAWNGSAWTQFGGGTSGPVMSLAVFGGQLYAGGEFASAAGVDAYRMARSNGGNWTPFSGGMTNGSDFVGSLVVAAPGGGASLLYAGGRFTHAAGNTVNHIAGNPGDHTWSDLDGGASGGTVDALATFDDGDGVLLYAGGSFDAMGGSTLHAVAAWDGSAWAAVGAGFPDGFGIGTLHGYLADARGPALYAGGYPDASHFLARYAKDDELRLRMRLLATAGASGHVGSLPAGLDCPAFCDGYYLADDAVQLTATPAADSLFAGWSGECSGSGTELLVVMTAPRDCSASFVRKRSLTVAVVGDGAVVSDPAGIDCSGGPCVADFADGSMVALTASPSAGNALDHWEGDCSGSEAGQQLVLDADRSCTAVFAAAQALTVLRAGDGAAYGTVTSTPAGIDCGSDCDADFALDSLVTLQADHAPEARFDGWSGDCSGSDPQATVTMGSARSCTATFVATPLLTVTRVGNGSGSVASVPAGIDCGDTCAARLDAGNVELTATAQAGSLFVEWSQDCVSSEPTVELALDGDRGCTAEFRIARTVEFNVVGSGRVFSMPEPSQLDCGSDCTTQVPDGQHLGIHQQAAADWAFAAWGGDCAFAASNQIFALPVDADKSCTATFLPRHELSIAVIGQGYVSSEAGITCPNVCSTRVTEGTTVQLEPDVPSDQRFGGWGGDCSGTDAPLSLLMDAPHDCTATFVQQYTLSTVVVGHGRVTSDPAGVDCGADGIGCGTQLDIDTTVTMTATALPGASFIGWDVACSGSDPQVQLVMDHGRTCHASFTTLVLPVEIFADGFE